MRTILLALTRHPVSLLGTAITTASAILIISLFGIVLLGYEGGPYIGILAFIALPACFVAGLLLIPLGAWLDRRRKRGAADTGGAFPVIDLNRDRTRNVAMLFAAATAINVVILALATYKGVHVMDSTEFCGEACHTVMAPELTTYRRSPHSRVACVDCHIGPGADWFVKSKLSGSWQLVSVALDLYPRPIPTPVENLRPARETCEQCHWPTKFIGDRLRVLTHYAEDEASTEMKTVLLLRVGGVQGRTSQGIHWHVDPGVRIRYRSDPTRETIHEVELTRPDGTVDLYLPPEPPAEGEGEGEWREMDCVDCHNRPTHVYRMPEDEIDEALRVGEIDRTLPFIRREGLAALRDEYPSQDEARDGIAERLRRFYEGGYPEVAADRRDAIDAAGRTLADIWTTNVFPSMSIAWGTYPNHIGHLHTPGCFRCHDDLHATEDGETISQDCSTCHTLLAMEETDPEILESLNP